MDDAPEAHHDDQWLARQLQAGMVNITAAASFGALSTVVTSPGGGAQVGAAAATVAAVSTVVSAARELREARAVQALDAAAAVADVDLDELLNRLLADPKRTELAARALSAAAASTLETKVAALGRALATGALAADEAKVDEQLVLVAVYADLEAPHVRLLAVLAAETPPVVDELHDGQPNSQGWRRAQIGQRLPGYGVTLESVLAVLLGHGLLSDEGPGFLAAATANTKRLTLTDPGRFSLEELRAVGH